MKTSVSDYDNYRNVCKEASENLSVFDNFKRDPRYTAILEHCPISQAQEIASWCLKHPNFSMEKLEMAKLNDSKGNPDLHFFGEPIGRISPSTLRYLKCVLDLESMFTALDGKRIVEIGSGYGGLCGIIKRVFDVKSYTLVDLPEPLALTRRYLEDDTNIYLTPDDVKSGESYDLVISNYAFTECSKAIQDRYINNILKNSKNGYITYNNISHLFDVDSYGKDYLKDILNMEETSEYPLSAKDNCILFWREV